ncbi:MAG: C1 family peptidase [Bdellovibrionota bacterium]
MHGLIRFRLALGLAASLIFSFHTAHANDSKNSVKSARYKCASLLTNAIPLSWVKKMAEEGKAHDPQVKRLRDNVQRNGFENTALNADILKSHSDNYTLELFQGPITDQQRSGRCWIFAGLNMIRSQMIAEGKVPENFEFSENYLHFFNMLEKSNRYLEEIIEQTSVNSVAKKLKIPGETRGEGLSSIFEPQISDGGWYEYFMFLVSKYGLMPKEAMPETRSALNTDALLTELKKYLASTAAEMLVAINEFESKAPKRMGKKKKEEKLTELLRPIKERGMQGVWKVLATHLGDPPTRFDYRMTGKSERRGLIRVNPTQVVTTTPKIFARKFIQFNPDDYVPVTTYSQLDPGIVYEIPESAIGPSTSKNHPYNLRFLNVDISRLEHLAVNAIEGGQAVWFAADIGIDVFNTAGIMHPKLFERDSIYNLSETERMASLPRPLRTYFGLASPNHAMLLTGLDRPDPKGPVVKFKNENSWGKQVGSQGIYHLYREWFQEYVFQIIVHKRFLTERERKAWGSEAAEVPAEADLADGVRQD